MSIGEAYIKLLTELKAIYDEREAANIADLVFESVTKNNRIDRIVNKQSPLDATHEMLLEDYTKQLLQHRPVQYVLNEAWFAGLKLFVNESVLIPRPETEELVEWIEEEVRSTKTEIRNVDFKILDVGTGSGCIPLALKKRLNAAEITAIDISEEALQVARRNAKENNLKVQFHQLDFLEESNWKSLEKFDVIVSNPPYVKQSEELAMHQNVLEHEPHIALFVPDEDALIFYKALAKFALAHLNLNGFLYVEINERLGQEVLSLFEASGLKNVILKKDLQEKDRMVKAEKAP